MIRYERLVTPPEHLDVLVEPAGERILAALTRQPAGLDRVLILDRPLSEWRADLRGRLGFIGPVIVTGHQTEFFHAGVFAKNIAADALATRAGGTAVFLAVDSDLPKTQQLAVPEITTDGLRRAEVGIPGCDPQRPVECQPAVPRQRWLDYFVRVASIHEHYDDSLLRPFADAWLAGDESTIDFGDAMARGWAALERALGLRGFRKLRISELCTTPEFRAFAAHLILHAGRSASEYNAAQAAYRRRHRVRNANRPVPPLATAGNRIEVPFWVFRLNGPRRRLYMVDHADQVELFAGQECIADMPRASLADPEQIAQPWPLERAGWRLRPRALTLSAFARLFLADLFIHGIGGAKYDEVTDDYVRGLLGVEPPPICCISATVHLPLPRTGVRPADVLTARRQARDLRFNPQRYLSDVPADLLRHRSEMIQRSNELRAQQSKDHSARRMIFEQIRRANERILGCDPDKPAEFNQRVQTLQHRRERDRIALDREYFAALHLKTTLAELASRLRDRLSGN